MATQPRASGKPSLCWYRAMGANAEGIVAALFSEGWLYSVNNDARPLMEIPLQEDELLLGLDALRKRYPLVMGDG